MGSAELFEREIALKWLLLLCLLSQGSLGSYKCNPRLLRTFKLQGLKYSLSEQMEICPTVRDTCCSFMDQVRILELWKRVSFPRIKTHIEKMKKWDHKVLGLHGQFKRLKKEDMVFFFKIEKMVPLYKRDCNMNTINLDYTPEEKETNMNWMLPGLGKIQEFNLKLARKRGWTAIRKGYNKDTPLYRFQKNSVRLFYEEFRWIGRVMYFVNELPFIHEKFIAARNRVQKLGFSGKLPRLRKVKRKVKKRRRFRKKPQKTKKSYGFVLKHDSKIHNELDIMYGRKKRIKERVKYSNRRRKRRRKRLRKKKRRQIYKQAFKQHQKHKRKIQKKKKKKKRKKQSQERQLLRNRPHIAVSKPGTAGIGAAWKRAATRRLTDVEKAKSKEGKGGNASKPEAAKEDYDREPMEEIKIRRRKSRVKYSASSEKKVEKNLKRKLRRRHRRKLGKNRYRPSRSSIHSKRRLRIQALELGLGKSNSPSKGHHLRRRLHRLKRKHKKEQRKLNQLKDQINGQWNNLFNPASKPTHTADSSRAPLQTQMMLNPNPQMSANYTPQQLAQIAQMQQGSNMSVPTMTPQMMMSQPQQQQFQSDPASSSETSPLTIGGQAFLQSPGEQGNIQYQNMQYSSQPGAQPIALSPQGYQPVANPAYSWNQMYANTANQQPQMSLKSGRILEEIKDQGNNSGSYRPSLYVSRQAQDPEGRVLEASPLPPKNGSSKPSNGSHSPNREPHSPRERVLRASDKELLQKYKVTKLALEAMKALRFKYGKALYKKHLNEVNEKTKYFSDFVLHGDPVSKLSALLKKLQTAVKLIKKKKSRKLIFNRMKTFLFGSKAKKGERRKPGLAERAFMTTAFYARFIGLDSGKRAPPINKLLRTIKYPKWRKFAKEDLKIKSVNDFVKVHGFKKLDKKIRAKFMRLGFPIKKKWKMKFILNIKGAYFKRLKKVIRFREKARQRVKRLESKIRGLKKRLKKAIARNNRSFKKYQDALAIPGEGPKPKDPDVLKTKLEVDLSVTSFPQQSLIQCWVDFRRFPFSEVNYSKRKERFCLRTWRRFRKIEVRELIQYIEISRDELRTILDMKKAMYCGVCDGTLQNNFDEERKLVLYSRRFCHDLVSQFQDYIRFRNIILINYYEEILQMLNCFQFNNQGGANFPVKTMLQKQKRRIKSIENCFRHLRKDTFYKHCYWVCSQFNIMKFNSFFDGDPDLLKTIYMKFSMFMRKYKQYRKKVDSFEGRRKKTRKRKRRRRRRKKNRRLRFKAGTVFPERLPRSTSNDQLPKAGTEARESRKVFQAVRVRNPVQTPVKELSNQSRKADSRNSIQTNPSQDSGPVNQSGNINHPRWKETHLRLKQNKSRKRRKPKRPTKRREDQLSIADQISNLILKHRQRVFQKSRKPNKKRALKDYRKGIENKKIISTIQVPSAQEMGLLEDKQPSETTHPAKRENMDKHQKAHRHILDIDGQDLETEGPTQNKSTLAKKPDTGIVSKARKSKKRKLALPSKSKNRTASSNKPIVEGRSTSPKRRIPPKTRENKGNILPNKKHLITNKTPANDDLLDSRSSRILTSISEVFANDIQSALLQQRLEKEENKKRATKGVFLTSQSGNQQERELRSGRDGRWGPKRKEMVAVPRRRMRPHEKIKRRISYLKLHTEGSNLPRYDDYRINTNLNNGFREVLEQQPIYHQTYRPMEVQTFRPFFAYSIHGFNPFRAQELMQMDFKPSQIVELTKRTNFKSERLTRLAVLQYMKLTRDDLASFNNDIKLKVNPVYHADHKSYHNTPPWPRWKLHSKYKKFERDYNNEKKEQFKGEFDNPDMFHFRGHYRNNTSNDYVAKMWFHFFGKS